MSDYKTLNRDELYGIFKDWSFSKEMQTAARNDMWKQKYGLWTFLSAACDEAASKCYEHINKFAQNLVDIDTCNIHSLKSIAESVDLGYLCKNIKEDHPIEILDLINTFSIPKHYLIDNESILSSYSSDLIFGKTAQRAATLIPDEVDTNLLKDIKTNIVHIRNILKMNLIYLSRKMSRSLKTDLVDFKLDSNDELINLTLNELLNKIDEIRNEDLSKYNKMKIRNDEGSPNYFYLLINVIKQNLYNKEYDMFINTAYIDNESNETIDLRWLFGAIINTISSNNKNYIKDFICYHFYSLISSKIKNEKLHNMFTFDDKHKIFLVNDTQINEYDLEEFKTKLYEYLNDDEVEELLNVNYYDGDIANSSNFAFEENKDFYSLSISLNLNNRLLDFAIYLRLLNNFIEKYNKTAEKKIDFLRFDILKIQFPNTFWFKNNNYEDVLFGNYESGIDGIIMKAAKELTDISLNVSYIREQIKTAIQQYNFIGTKRIATDILTDFFIKNYSKESDWGYISDNDFSISNDITSSVLKPLSTLLNPNKNKRFSIDVVEYYDSTEYLNIESDLGSVNVGSYVSRVDEEVKYFIDSNNLITSGTVTSNVYEDLYVPCSYFIHDYNKRFWENEMMSFGVVNENLDEIDFDKYDSFYSQYVTEYSELLNADDKKKYIKNELKRLLSSVWDTFALSGYDASYISDDMEIRKKYINSNDNCYKYANIVNRYFPTISPIQNIEGLYEVSDVESMNILYLAKIYYSNVIDKIISSTKEMLNMHDENGVPFDGWKQKYVNFHGYSTYYEYSDNKTIKSNEAMKIFGFDGPWSYSVLQRMIFDDLNENTDFKYLTKYTDVEDDSEFSVYDIYKKCIAKKYYDHISSFKIDKIENDIFDNVFTLFKKRLNESMNGLDTEPTGVVYFRSYDMPLSVPIVDADYDYSFVEIDGVLNNEIVRTLLNNCVDFGVSNDIMWVFGKYDAASYKLVSFKYDFSYNHLIVDNDSFREYTNNGLDLFSINDFVGAKFNDDASTLNLYTFNSLDAISKLDLQKNENLEISGNIYSQNVIINANILNVNDNTLDVRAIEVDNVLFPSILYHNESSAISDIEYDNTHRIWKIEEYDDRYYVCYEALNNEVPSSMFDYYFMLKSYVIAFETVRFNFKSVSYNLSNEKNRIEYSSKITVENTPKTDECRILLHKNLANVDRKIELIYDGIVKYPKCTIDKENLYIDVTPISFIDSVPRNIYSVIIMNLLNVMKEKNSDNYITFDFIYENFDEIFAVENMLIGNSVKTKIRRNIEKLRSQIEYIINNKQDLMNDVKIVSTFDSKKQYEENLISLEDAQTDTILANDLYREIPVLSRCINDKIKIVVWFKNESGITFIGDHAMDLDLTCYIDTYEERNNKVGYGNNYKATKYITWDGDVTNGGYEYVEIKTGKYKLDKYNAALSEDQNKVRINLNFCWHKNSEIKNDNVFISVFYANIKQNIPIDLVGTSEKSCGERSIVLTYDMNDNTLHYEKPKNYLAVKLTMKQKLCGYEDGIPDIQAGIVNMIESDWNLIKNSSRWNCFTDSDHDEETDDKSYAIYVHGLSKFKHYDLKYNYVTILFRDYTVTDAQEIEICATLKHLLSEVFNCRNMNIYGIKKYDEVRLDDIYFGNNTKNVDDNTGIAYSFYAFLRPSKFRSVKDKVYNTPILRALDPDIAMKIKEIEGDY